MSDGFKAEQELDAILLRLDAFDFGSTHLAVEGRRCGNGSVEVTDTPSTISELQRPWLP